MTKQKLDQYWNSYLSTLPQPLAIAENYSTSQFGDTPALADQLGALILEGIKTATCSALWEWEAEGSPLPEVGSKSIVLDGGDNPLCIIAVTEVSVRAFNKVDAQFAYDEGEGDRSLEFWREEHWKFFSRVLPKIGKQPTLDMPLVCERFRVAYHERSQRHQKMALY